MQSYELTLKSDVCKSFRCQKAANSLDIDVEKKSVHKFKVNADLDSDYSVGLIVGASGSGKTTLAKSIFGEDCFKEHLDLSLPVIDQLPKHLSYDECAALLAGVGLTAVPCWIRPAYTLSNGQRARAEAAIAMSMESDVIIDEWTSVVDRTVAKVMSHCVQKHARRFQRKIILCSCHYDVVDWLNPDWIIDCNKQTYTDRRSLRQSFQREERLNFSIREVNSSTWKYFSKYHYLSERLPGGKIFCYGLFDGANQVGFQCYANYVPRKPGTNFIFHANRTVIHPDYAGLGLGIKLIDQTAKLMSQKKDYRIMAKFSSTPIYRSMKKSPHWKLKNIGRDLKTREFGGCLRGPKSSNANSFRTKVKTYSFEFVG